MRVEAYYIFTPTEELRRKIDGCGIEGADLLLDGQLWTSAEGGHTVWREADYEARVKVLFLARLRTEYVELVEEKDPFHELVEELLGYSPSVAETFDRWWTLVRYGGNDDVVGDVEQFVSRSSLGGFDPTGRVLVDEWIRALMEKKE